MIQGMDVSHCAGGKAGGFKYFLFSPRNLGEDEPKLTIYNIFQMGWFNHQLEILFCKQGFLGTRCLVQGGH